MPRGAQAPARLSAGPASRTSVPGDAASGASQAGRARRQAQASHESAGRMAVMQGDAPGQPAHDALLWGLLARRVVQRSRAAARDGHCTGTLLLLHALPSAEQSASVHALTEGVRCAPRSGSGPGPAGRQARGPPVAHAEWRDARHDGALIHQPRGALRRTGLQPGCELAHLNQSVNNHGWGQS